MNLIQFEHAFQSANTGIMMRLHAFNENSVVQIDTK